MIKMSNRTISPPAKMANSIRDLLSDFLTLGELQIQLFRADLQDGRRHLTRGVILLAVSITLLLASLPIALIAVSYGLCEAFGLPLWAGFSISAGCGFVVGSLILFAASRWLSSSVAFFHRSSEEFSNNLQWIKTNVSVHQSPASPSD